MSNETAPEKPRETEIYEETSALASAVRAILSVDDDARDRIMGYLVSRFGAGYAAAQVVDRWNTERGL